MDRSILIETSKSNVMALNGKLSAIFNTGTQKAAAVDDRILSILKMLEVPMYYGELENLLVNRYNDMNSVSTAELIGQLMHLGVIEENTDRVDCLVFHEYPDTPAVAATHLTYKCNLSCDYCYNEKQRSLGNRLESTSEEWRCLLEKLRNSGVTRFDVTGGEPLLKSELFPIFRGFMKDGVQIELITNGTLVNDEKVAEQIKHSFSRVTVSLDSYSPDEHDAHRGAGSHAATVKGMKLLTSAGVFWQAKGVLSKENSKSLAKTKEFVNDLGGKDYALSIMVGEKRDENSIRQQFFNSVIDEKLDSNEMNLYPDRNFDLNKQYGIPCAAGRQECAIDPYGNVYPCRVMMSPELKCGNLHDEDLESIWKNSSVLHAIRNLDYKKIEKCGECDFLRICLGGCRAIAYAQAGTITGPIDSFGCAMRKRRVSQIISSHVSSMHAQEEGCLK